MPSPVGHTLLGLGVYVIWCRNLWLWLSQWFLIIWIIFCANLPDFDLFIGLANGNLSKYHQGYTHTLGFAILFGFITFLFLKLIKFKDAASISLLTFILIFSHVFLDAFNYDSRPPIGVMLFWPFSSRHFNPCQIFYPVPHTQPADIFTSFFMNAVMREIILLFIPLMILIYFKLKRDYAKS